jgi:hypothetical protein
MRLLNVGPKGPSLLLNGSILPSRGAAMLRPYKVRYRKLSRAEPAGYVLGVVGEDDVGAGALDTG